MKTILKLGLLLVMAVTTASVINFFSPKPHGQTPVVANKGFHHAVQTFFRKKDKNGEYINMLPPPSHPPYRITLSEIIVDSRYTSSASLAASPALIDNGEKVTVSWNGIPDPSKRKPYDWIGLYCPSNADTHMFIDYWFVNESPTYSKGYGSATFTLYNMRVDCEFRYYGNDTYTELMAVSNKVSFVNGMEAPLHGHLALTGDPSEMRVQWTTGTESTPTVFYGTNPSSLDFKATGTSKTYKASDMCGPPANMSIYFMNPGYLHDVLLTDLEPNTQYYYTYGSEGVYSEVKPFNTSLKKGDRTPYTFVAYGDMDLTLPPGADTTALLVHKEIENGASFVAHIGDISYAVGIAFRWEIWFALVEPYSSLAPYMVAIGNHEQDHLTGGSKDPSHGPGNGFHPSWGNYGDDSGGECGVPMNERFHMPDNGNALWWYSYDYGMVHYTVFSTEHNFTAGSRQYEWLANDLRSVDRSVTPWLILMGHRAMYSSEKYPSDVQVGWAIRNAIENLLFNYQVDLALWGHYHAYQRTCAVYQKQCNPKGTVHITVGTAGCSLDHAGLDDVPWSKHFESNFGYGRVTVANSSAMLWEFIRNSDKAVADSVWLTK